MSEWTEPRYGYFDADPAVEEHVFPFGADTACIADEVLGGVILYTHRDHAQRIFDALMATENPSTQHVLNQARAQRYVRELADLAHEALDTPTGDRDQQHDMMNRLNEVLVLLTNIGLYPDTLGSSHCEGEHHG